MLSAENVSFSTAKSTGRLAVVGRFRPRGVETAAAL
jgi:hypothetical protein